MSRRRPFAGLAAVVVCTGLVAGATGCGNDGQDQATATKPPPDEAVLTPDSVDPEAVKRAQKAQAGGGGKVVHLGGAGSKKTYSSEDGVSPGAPTDAEVKADLKQARAELSKFKRYLGTTAFLQTGPKAAVLPDGTAVAPDDAPEPVKRVIQAGNAIAKFPYKWGGGHGAWRDNGYDCSGSVSFALAAAGLVNAPLTSGGFIDWGDPGIGEWITIYTNPGHIFMIVAGLRFDTSGAGRAGTRWQTASRSTGGFTVRHQPGL